MVIKVFFFFKSIRKNIWDGKMDSKKDQPFFLADRYIYFFSPHDTDGLSEHLGTSKSCGFIIILCIHRWQVVGKSP